MPYPTFCNLDSGGQEPNLFFYHPDHLGSTGVITDNYASVTQGFLYAPFGELMYEHDPSWQNNRVPKYAFNAKELDEENGMYYYSARYYAPPTFISRDPMFEDYPSISPYTYCANNPLIFVDPTGMNIDDPPGDGNNPYKNQPIGYESGRGTEKNPIVLPDAIIIEQKNPESQGETPQTPQRLDNNVNISTTPIVISVPIVIEKIISIPFSRIFAGANIFAALSVFMSGDTRVDSSPNEKHGDGGRALGKAEKQIKDLEKLLEKAKGSERARIKQKIKNIKENAQRKRKGVEHSRGNKK